MLYMNKITYLSDWHDMVLFGCWRALLYVIYSLGGHHGSGSIQKRVDQHR